MPVNCEQLRRLVDKMGERTVVWDLPGLATAALFNPDVDGDEYWERLSETSGLVLEAVRQAEELRAHKISGGMTLGDLQKRDCGK
jgi:hypothetical protein